MTYFLLGSTVAIFISLALVLLLRRNLRQRTLARKLRAIFIATVDDLVGKPELPDAHSRQLAEFAAIPEGWITRYAVFAFLKAIVTGRRTFGVSGAPRLEQVPHNLRPKYVTAILALALSDSYRCALLGRIWRGAYGWVGEAVKEVKPDLNAHATRSGAAVGMRDLSKHSNCTAYATICATSRSGWQ